MVPVVGAGVRIGSVDVVSEPKDAVGRSGEPTALLGAVGLGVTLAVTGLLYLLVGRVLEPVQPAWRPVSPSLSIGTIGSHERPQPAELAVITNRSNAARGSIGSDAHGK